MKTHRTPLSLLNANQKRLHDGVRRKTSGAVTIHLLGSRRIQRRRPKRPSVPMGKSSERKEVFISSYNRSRKQRRNRTGTVSNVERNPALQS